MIQHNMQTLKVGHKVRLLDCYFVILSFFILPLGDTNRGLLVRYIYIIYYFIIYILYIIYTHGAKKWQNDKMTKWLFSWRLKNEFRTDWWMISMNTDGWLPWRQTNDTRIDVCVCEYDTCVRASVICRRVPK